MMDNKLNLPDLDESYYDGIERIVGTKNDSSFLLPTDVLKKRKKFWDSFFQKYEEESLIENDLDLCDNQHSVPHKKSFKFIQHWVDNGTLPYKNAIDVDKESEHCDTTKMLTNSSSSSVDTAAYILSNNNTTNKVTTIAIVEGAKQVSLANCENEDIGSMKTVKLVTDAGNRDNNDNVLQPIDESSIEATSTICPAQIEENVKFGRNDEPVVNTTPKINYNKLFTEKLMHLISKKENRNSYMKENLFNRGSSQSEQTNFTEESSVFQNEPKRLSQRKKLYSGRDSPVDIVSTIRRRASIIPGAKAFLHPALDSDTVAKRRTTFLRKRRTQQISMNHSRLMNNNTFLKPNETIRKKWRKTKNSSEDVKQSVRELKTQKTSFSSIDGNSTVTEDNNPNMDTSSIANTKSEIASSLTSASEFKKPSNNFRKFRVTKSKLKNQIRLSLPKPNGLKKVTIPQNMEPLVYLERLSESDIRKYKTLKSSTINFDNILRPVIRLKRLQKSDIEKYKKSNELVEDDNNSHSASCSENSSEFISDKNRKSKKRRILSDLNVSDRVTRLSKRGIENNTSSSTLEKDNINSRGIKKNNMPSTTKNNNLQSRTIQIQNDGTTNTRKTLRSQNALNNSFRNCKTIHLFEDSDSDNSTVLIHQCSSFKSPSDISTFHDSSNVSLNRKIGTTISKIRKNDVNVRNDEIEISSKSRCKRGNKSDKQKNSFTFLFDDNNDFVKLISQKTNKRFENNIGIDPSNTDDDRSISKSSVTSERTSSPSRHSAENKFRKWKFRRSTMIKDVHEKNLRNKKDELPRRIMKNCKSDENDAQTAKEVKDKLRANHLYFRTQLFDTDSEASSC
ncbi:uncharacterized protein LOC144470240 [Augochlora pura]